MHENYLKTYTSKNVELGYGIVTANKVNLRAGPGTSYRSVASADIGDKGYIIGFNQQWYKVICKGQICYIRSDYLELTQIPYENSASPNEPRFFSNGKPTGMIPSADALNKPDISTVRSIIVSEARRYLGVPYVWGGSTPRGFDCSGFTQYFYGKIGYELNRTAVSQLENGIVVAKANMQPGDLVFFKNTTNNGRIATHVGIYRGDGKMIHSGSSKGVVVVSLSQEYWQEHFLCARRVLIPVAAAPALTPDVEVSQDINSSYWRDNSQTLPESGNSVFLGI
jgi:N-acetylmuramoyl-L-alanine amidase